MKKLLCLILAMLPVISFASTSAGDDDWRLIAQNVRIVNYDKGESSTADIYINTINGNLAAQPADYDDLIILEWSDRPEKRMMFEYRYYYWYLTLASNYKIPEKNNLRFVQPIIGYDLDYGRSLRGRLFQNTINSEMLIQTDDPYFGWTVERSDRPDYRYCFKCSGFWYHFNL